MLHDELLCNVINFLQRSCNTTFLSHNIIKYNKRRLCFGWWHFLLTTPVAVAMLCGLRRSHICINILVPICLVRIVRHWSATVSASEEGNVNLPGEYMRKYKHL